MDTIYTILDCNQIRTYASYDAMYNALRYELHITVDQVHDGGHNLDNGIWIVTPDITVYTSQLVK